MLVEEFLNHLQHVKMPIPEFLDGSQDDCLNETELQRLFFMQYEKFGETIL